MKKSRGKSDRTGAKPKTWDGSSHLARAFLIDVDGTLASKCRRSPTGWKRELRPTAVEALRLMSSHAHVFLWSKGGPENGKRLAAEFPEIGPFISGFFHKDDFPLHLVEQPIAIDDEGVLRGDAPHFQEIYVIPEFTGGADDGVFLALVRELCLPSDVGSRPIE